MSNIFAKLVLFLLIFFAICETSVAQTVCQSAITPTPSTFTFSTAASTPPNLATSYVGTENSPTAVLVIECNVALQLNLISLTTSVRYELLQNLIIYNGTRSIGLQLSHEASFSPAHSSVGNGSTLNSATLLNLSLLSGQNLQIPIHVRTIPTSVWPKPGLYTGSFQLAVTGNICTVGVIACLLSVPISPNTTTTFTVNLNVPKYCQFITVPSTIAMGSVSFLEDVTNSQIPVTIRCGQDEDFKIYATSGENFSTTRRLKSSANNFVGYEIFHPGSTTQTLSQTTGFDAVATGQNQSFNFPLRVNSGQTTPPAGTYTDTVRFVVEY